MDPTESLAVRLDALAAQVAKLEERVARLEPTPLVSTAAPTPVEEKARGPVRFDVTLVGRSLIVLGGGYLLRAITELGVVPQAVGVAAGLALAVALVALADRAAGRGRMPSSWFHGATALVIAYPLLGETVVRFGLIGPYAGALLIAAFCAATLLVAQRRRDVGLAWVVTVATLVAAPVLAVETGSALPFVFILTALLAGVGWLARRLEQRFLVWPVAVATDVVMVLFTQLVLWERSPVPPWGAVAVAFAFFAVSAGGPLARAVHDHAATTIFEMLQVAAAFLSFVAAARIAGRLDGGAGFTALALIAGAGVVVIALRSCRGRTQGYWTSVGLAILLVELSVSLDGVALALADLVPAAALLVVVRRREHPLGELQAVAALAAAALASRLFAASALGLAGDPSDLARPGPGAFAILAVLLVAAVVGIREPPVGAGPLARAAKLLAILLAVLTAGGVTAWAGIALAHAAPPAAATIRTAVLSHGAVALALASRYPRTRSAALLVYPVLALTAAKIAIEDLRVGVPATLFASLALFGVALIIAPRLRPRA